MGSASNYAFDLYSPFFLSTNSCKKVNKVPKFRLGHFFFFLFIEFTFIFGGGFLVLLVFGNQIVHVGLGFSEFHLIHTLTSVPSKKALRLNIAVNCSEIRLKSSWMAVELPMKVAAIL